ncbi:MAG TPA: protein-export chaperone SecB, partial [Propylenella sp.]
LDFSVNVNAKPQTQSEFEVELKLEAKAARGEDTLFIVEVTYAGLFQLRNVPQEQVHPLLLIECPRLLFPFARQILADATRQGGFPPLMIDPVDFTALYRQRMAEVNVQQMAAKQS